jgi:glycosyltransferase involved in cell wall biosynthesis
LIWRPIFKQFLQSADHNLAASREIASVAESIAPGIAVEPLTNGVDTNFFRKVKPLLANPARGTKRLVAPRRLVEKNGVEHLIRAMPEILEGVKAELVVIGDGPKRSSLERLSEELGVNKQVTFLGSRPHADMPGLLSSADLAVFPSLMEATSVAALESLACEVPVAASRVGGLPEIIQGDVGALFEPGDPASLSRAVVDLLQKSGLEKFGTTARQRVVDFWSNDRLADRHAEVYEAVIQNRQAA